MSISVEVNVAALDAIASGTAAQMAHKVLFERARADMQEYAPVDTGALRDSVRWTEDTITWPIEYASIVYNMDDSHIHTEKNPLARSHWGEVAKQEHMAEWEQVVREELVRW